MLWERIGEKRLTAVGKVLVRGQRWGSTCEGGLAIRDGRDRAPFAERRHEFGIRLALGSSRLDIASARLGKLNDVNLTFVGLTPTQVRLGLEALTLRRAKLGR